MFDTEGIKTNLHVVLIMDYTNPNFSLNCESNPAFYKECSVQWLERWSKKTMIKVRAIHILLSNYSKNVFNLYVNKGSYFDAAS
jgi:hypothetical protein